MNKLLLMSGSIACAKSTGLISAWVKSGHQVKVVATPSVEQFVGHATLEGLSGHPVLADTFGKGEMMSHINISRWADVIVVCPATANVINKMATGLADDMLTTTWIAAYDLKKP
ncbi:MAG: bifunctional phosphopantothenoylcysteine decarboxylase/phosphopantothenate--cysteine ligase CoaBC, partial [Proteobacteria bacterium]|nr:bifunctional phosphopantothenoylcysteine decarboxylase/phosphopantothenate--cysteine ligase CoaBC [Pseudomonadota bacterium]